MQIGSALTAPQGFGVLEAGLTYYLLRHNRITRSAQLVLFARAKQHWVAHLYSIEQSVFEDAYMKGLITEVAAHNGVAPFLQALDGKDPLSLDLNRQFAKRQSDKDRANERLLKISSLLEQEHEILCSPNPEKRINALAQANRLNAQRTRFWFFAYLCFGRNIHVLIPHYFQCGRWDRLQKPQGPKLGRKSLTKGMLSGQRLNAELIERLVKAYSKYSAEGKTLTSIYQEAMRKDFKANLVTDDDNVQRLVSSNAQTIIPTFDQFRYQIFKAIGQDNVQAQRWGQSRYRRSKQPHRGKFSSSVSNLYESVEADAHYTEDRPKSSWGKGHLEPLCVTRLVDVASGMRLGIGFGFGSESSESYNAAMFCAAISKKKFCKLFGIEIKEAEWPSQGIPPTYITDRGPGIKSTRTDAEGQLLGPTIHEFTPSGQGQSKAVVESSQRRRTKLEGPKQYACSNITAHAMMVREIRRLLTENKTADMSGRLTPQMYQEHTGLTPLGVWNFLDERGRNDGALIGFDEAVRSYLMPTEVSLSRAGAMLKRQAYSSKALKTSEVIKQLGNHTINAKAYVLPACVRHIWVEVDGKLLELEAELPLRDDAQMLYRPLHELDEEKRVQAKLKSKHRQQRHGFAIDEQNKLQKEHGADWNSKTLSRGQYKQTREAKAEQALLRETYGHKVGSPNG